MSTATGSRAASGSAAPIALVVVPTYNERENLAPSPG